MVESKSVGKTVFSAGNAILLTVISVVCILPIIHVIMSTCIMAEKIFIDRIPGGPEIIYCMEWLLAYTAICFRPDTAGGIFYIDRRICPV